MKEADRIELAARREVSVIFEGQRHDSAHSREETLPSEGGATSEGCTPAASADPPAGLPLFPSPPKTLLLNLLNKPGRPALAFSARSYSALTKPWMLFSSSVTSRIQSLLPVETRICLWEAGGQ